MIANKNYLIERLMKLNKNFILILVLAVLNFIIFQKHLLGTVTFPWDFPLSYYALPYYWTNSLNQGVFPFWVPFQGMGYPLLMNLQTSIFYFPLYLFVLFKIPYTLHAANIFQIFHIFIGAIGMYFLVRKLFANTKVAILAAIVFNLYGGFYSNSEHVDIIRSFCFLPWIIYCLPLDKVEKIKYRTLVLLPLFFLLLWTGGYPGIYLSTTFLCFTYLTVFVFINKQNLRIVIVSSLLIILGIGIATISFLPTYLLQSEISRSTDVSIPKTFLSPSHLLSFFYPIYYKSLPSDISMRSVYLAMPFLFFISYVRLIDVKKYLALFLIGIIAYFMATESFFYYLIIKMLPPLGLSRFPTSDYRTFFVIILMIFCSIGVINFINKKSSKFLILRIGILAFLYGALFFLIQQNKYDKVLIVSGLLIIFILGLLSFAYARSIISINLLFVFISFLCVSDFFKNNYKKNSYYVDKTTVGQYKNLFGNLNKPSEQLTTRLKGVETRPNRNNDFKVHKLGFKGYITGDYMIGDYSGPMQFRRQKTILGDSNLLHFAISKWKAIDNDSVVNLLEYDKFSNHQSNKIKNVFYGCNYIQYSIQSPSTFSITENEVYFKGWSATVDSDKTITIYPTENNGFRKWVLPAGNYTMTASFSMPYFDLAAKISIAFLLLWSILLIFLKKHFNN